MFQDWRELVESRVCATAPTGEKHPGFHGDIRLIEILEDYLSSSDAFIESGAYLAGTLYYVASNFEGVQCYSCEPIQHIYDSACSVVKECENVSLVREASPDFINNLIRNNPELKSKRCVFWLDGHGMSLDSSPLPSEVSIIAKNFDNAVIFIDDVQIPEDEDFEWQFSYSYISDIIKSCPDNFDAAVPSYNKSQTSCIVEPVGWALITNRSDVDFVSYPVTLVKGRQDG